jgi:hypothetical protein
MRKLEITIEHPLLVAKVGNESQVVATLTEGGEPSVGKLLIFSIYKGGGSLRTMEGWACDKDPKSIFAMTDEEGEARCIFQVGDYAGLLDIRADTVEW